MYYLDGRNPSTMHIQMKLSRTHYIIILFVNYSTRKLKKKNLTNLERENKHAHKGTIMPVAKLVVATW